MLAIERVLGEELHLIDETGRRTVINVHFIGVRRVKLQVKAPTGVAIVRPEKGPIVEAGLVAKARAAAARELNAGAAA